MKSLILGALLVLAACATGNSQADFLKAEAGYTALLQAAAHYTALPRCGSAGATQVCSDQKVVDQIRPAANSADAAVQAAENIALSGTPNQTALSLAISAAQNATAALTAILQQYSVPLK